MEEVSTKYNVLKEFGNFHIGDVLDAAGFDETMTPERVGELVADGTLEAVVEDSGEAKVGDACTTEDGQEGTISEGFVCVANDVSTEETDLGSGAVAPEGDVNGARHPLA